MPVSAAFMSRATAAPSPSSIKMIQTTTASWKTFASSMQSIASPLIPRRIAFTRRSRKRMESRSRGWSSMRRSLFRSKPRKPISQPLRDSGAIMKWITREHIKVDRVACPWLIRRFIDPDAEFLFVEESQLIEMARAEHAIPFDAPRFAEIVLNHRENRCTFEAILEDYKLADPALLRLGLIVRAAD